MAEKIKIIDPFDSYEMTSQENAQGVYGSDLLTSVQSLQVGFGTQVLRIDRDGLWLGAETFASAPFSVSMTGAMVATSLDLSGYLQVGDSLADIQALIGDIGDISSDLGTISAGSLVGVTVTGGTVRTSSSGARVVMDGSNDALYVYDASAKRMQLDNDEITFYNSSGNSRGGIKAGTTEVYFHALNGGNLRLEAEGSLYTITFDIAGTTRAYITTSGLNMNQYDIVSADQVGGDAGSFDFSGTTIKVDEEISLTVDNSEDLGDPSFIWNDIYVSDVNYDTLTLMSDERQKENIVPAPYGLAQILQLSPILFNYKTKVIDQKHERLKKMKRKNIDRYNAKLLKAQENIAKRSARKHLGFTAQAVQTVIPELVRQNDAGTYVLQNTELIPVLVKAVQELYAEVEALKNQP